LIGRHDFAHGVLDMVEFGGGVFDARADRRTDMNGDFARVDVRKEIAAKPRREQERGSHHDQKAGHKAFAVRQRETEHDAIDAAHAFEAMLEAALKPYQRIARRRRVVMAVVRLHHGSQLAGGMAA